MEKLKKHKEKKVVLSKKAVLTITISVIVVALTILLLLFRPIYISSANGAASRLADSFFDKQVTLDSYKIKDVSVVLYGDKNYIQVSYSVKPKESFSDKWNAENGKTGDDGWVTDKTGFISFYRLGKIYFTGINAKPGI